LSTTIKTGDEVEVDLKMNLIRILPNGPTYLTRDMGDAAEIVNAGGIFEYARKTGMISR
jgi:3-isopropylmalate/(R)-2-methylmalate dehydratase small subunit